MKILFNRIEHHPYSKKIFECIDTLPLHSTYVLGGTARDIARTLIYGQHHPLNDLDLLVNCPTAEVLERLQQYAPLEKTSLGAPRIKCDEEFHIDIVPFSLWNYANNPQHVMDIIHKCDITTSALGISLETGNMYGARAIESIRKKEIDIQFENSIFPVHLARLAQHARKLDYVIGEHTVDLIQKKYTPHLDEEILAYANKKGYPEPLELITIIRNLNTHICRL